MKLIYILLTLLLSLDIFASSEAILKLDTKGHTGLIKDVIITKNKDIITAGYDKTIRVWDSKTGQEKRKFLGQIGSGPRGMLYAIALSNDEKYLAVGGFINNGNNERIRIYNYQTSKLLKVLKSHTDVVNDLSFSSDSKYLISGSADETSKIWDVKNDFKLKDTITFHTDFVYAVKMIKKHSKYFLISASDDNQVALYDVQRKKIINSYKSSYKLRYITSNSKHIAVCGLAKEILIFDYDLNYIKTIKTKTTIFGLSYSPNGKFLISGTGSYPRSVGVYNANKNYKLKISFDKHTNLTTSVGFLDNSTAVSAGGSNNEIYIWDINTGKVKKKIAGVGNRIWSVGINGNSVAWGIKGRNVHTKNSWSVQNSINLDTYQISEVNNQSNKFKEMNVENANYSLFYSKGGKYSYGDGVLNIKNGNKIEAKIVRNSTDGLRHRCYGWYKDYIVSGGAGGFIKIYNKAGTVVANLVGHTGEIWSIALDGDRLVSGSDDQTIKVWDLSKLGESKTIYPMLNIFISMDKEWIVWSKSGYFNSSVGGDKYVGYHINQGVNKESRYVGSDKYFDTFYRPDIIENILKTGSEKKAIAYAGRVKKVKTIDVKNSLPPVVSLLTPSSIKTKKKTITVKFSVESDEDIKEIIILHNGERLNTRGLKRKNSKNSKSVTIELDSGENIVSIKARNKFAISDEVLVYATKKTINANIYKPTLYLLSIGVSKYENPEYNLGVADKDAKAISKMFQSQKGKIYKDIFVKTLTNSDAHSDNILDGLDWIDRETTSKDVVIIFIAGHGVNDDKGTYYFLSHDANLDRLRRTAIKWSEIQDTISNLPSKVILLADTCHSGSITGNRRDITSAVKSIVNSGSGSVIMTATTGSGYSYEKEEWGHGAFTKSFLDGLGKMKADYDDDGSVTIKEIDLYITNNVKKLTHGKQKPTTIIPNSVPDFAIGVR